ncbi:MAG TPA: hypothetical protein VN611_04300 [Patescibacteria group bacterium]|nr:hypothetical protein [Patescibacteria group bacterium]
MRPLSIVAVPEESAKEVGGIQELTGKVQAAIDVLEGRGNDLLQFIDGTVKRTTLRLWV